ncbi:MAG TPA: hypothetical protein VMY42_19180 [Thermoguttaceae bacterium]|nr:hypothetical protein [Thermoguttaceae bacterium]
MDAERLDRPPVLSALSHVLALLGVLAGTWLALLVLREHIHALGHNPHELSTLGQIMGDHSRVPRTVAVCLFVTLAVVLFSERLVSGRSTSRRFLAVVSCGAAVSLGLFIAVGAYLHVADVRFIPFELQDLPHPFLFVSTATLVTAAAGLLVLVLYLWRRSELWLLVYAMLPMGGAVLVTLSFPREKVAEIFGTGIDNFGNCYPRIARVSAAIVLLMAAGVVLQRLWRRKSAEEHAPHIGLLVAGTWAWALFFLVSLGVLYPYHHMCFKAPTPIQEQAARAIAITFLALWAITGAVQSWRYFARRRSTTPPAGGRPPES